MDNVVWNQGIVEKAVYLDRVKADGGMGLGFSHRQKNRVKELRCKGNFQVSGADTWGRYSIFPEMGQGR